MLLLGISMRTDSNRPKSKTRLINLAALEGHGHLDPSIIKFSLLFTQGIVLAQLKHGNAVKGIVTCPSAQMQATVAYLTDYTLVVISLKL